MAYRVDFAESAGKDLFDIYYFIAINDSFAVADKVVSKIKKTCYTLSDYPMRGHCPKEVKNTLPELLEIICKPYRIIYEVKNNTVQILFVIDGRRDVIKVLERRFLR